MFSCVQLCVTLWTVARQAALSMEFSRQENQSGLTISYYRGSSQPRDQTCVSCISCIGSQIHYHWGHLGSPKIRHLKSFKICLSVILFVLPSPTDNPPSDLQMLLYQF